MPTLPLSTTLYHLPVSNGSRFDSICIHYTSDMPLPPRAEVSTTSIRKKKEGKRKKTILHPQPSIDSPRQSTNRHPSPNGYSSKREHWCFARVHAEVSKQVGRGSVRKQMEGQRVPGGPLFATAAPSTGGDATSFPASRSRPRYRKSIRRPR